MCDLPTWNINWRYLGVNNHQLVWFFVEIIQYKSYWIFTLSPWVWLPSLVEPKVKLLVLLQKLCKCNWCSWLYFRSIYIRMTASSTHKQEYIFGLIHAATGLSLWLAKVYIWSTGNFCYMVTHWEPSLCNLLTSKMKVTFVTKIMIIEIM